MYFHVVVILGGRLNGEAPAHLARILPLLPTIIQIQQSAIFFQSIMFTSLEMMFIFQSSNWKCLITKDVSSPLHIVKRRICNLISVPQITRLLLGDAIISSKADLRSGSKKEKGNSDKVRNNKAMWTIWFIRILYLKQQSNIL